MSLGLQGPQCLKSKIHLPANARIGMFYDGAIEVYRNDFSFLITHSLLVQIPGA